MEIRQYLASLNLFTRSEIENALGYFKPKSIAKSDYLIREGNICTSVAFVSSGVFRTFYRDNIGKELTYCITFPGTFMAAYSSYITGTETIENIQALTDCELLIIQKRDIESLASKSRHWLLFLKLMAEQQYIELEYRIFQLQKEKAKVRYENLLHKHPEYSKHIPLQYLASYLGITQRHLSRIRKRN